MDIPGLPLKALDTALSHELAETHLLQNDLHGSLASLQLWVRKYVPPEKSDDETQIVLDSLFRDGIVQFVACFDPNATIALNVDLIYGENSGAQSYIDWMRDLRNAYAAHRFGAARQCVAGISIRPETGEFVDISFLSLLYAGPIPETHQSLLRFVQTAVEFIDDQARVVEEEFAKAARALSNDERLALPMARAYGMDPHEIGLSRGALQRKRGAGPTKASTD